MKWNVGALKKATDMVQQKKETLGDLLIKIGGDLLFHNRFESREQSHACMSFAEMKKRERS